MTDLIITPQGKNKEVSLCWICKHSAANSREHKTKRSDLAAVFEAPTQVNPLFYHDMKQRNKRVGSFDAKRLKAPIQICDNCNSARTQPHDFAWEHMSAELRKRALVTDKWVHTNKIFAYETRRQMINVHLYFVKQFGGMLMEARAINPNVPIDIQPFSDAIMSNRPHAEVFLEFGNGDGTVGRSNLEFWTTDFGSVFAGWLYQIDNIAVNILFLQSGRWESKPDRWHPLSPTNSKRFQIKDFANTVRATVGEEQYFAG
jgi:hypothetical protein